jgi:hypothetical protein
LWVQQSRNLLVEIRLGPWRVPGELSCDDTIHRSTGTATVIHALTLEAGRQSFSPNAARTRLHVAHDFTVMLRTDSESGRRLTRSLEVWP